MWVDAALKALGEIVSWRKQSSDPEVIKFQQRRHVAELIRRQKLRIIDLVSVEINAENKEQNAIDLGLAVNERDRLLNEQLRLETI